MSNELIGLKPEAIWRHFQSLLDTPRPSKKEEKAVELLKKFGEDLGLETIVDEVGNVIIKKPATPGMEDRKGIIMQGHLDMVPQKNSDTNHDFENDPIPAYIDGDWVTARGTTLGADNGIGVAAAMAVFEAKDLVHGPIEGLFTVDEETGMTGAFNLKSGILDGDILLNMDSEEEGELCVGCAGGINSDIQFSYKEEDIPSGSKAYKLALTGLKGGHSGLDINLGRGNSNKLLIRFLRNAVSEFGVRLASIDGGSLRNAIPRESFAVIVVPEGNANGLEASVKKYADIFKAELSSTEPDLSFEISSTDMPSSIIEGDVQNKMINAVYGCPNGVIRMSDDMENLVETSSNLAIVKSSGDKIEVMCLIRSSVDTAKEDAQNAICSVFELAGAKVEFVGSYPGWKPNMNSAILKTMQEVYNGMYNVIPGISAMHAGLECGLLGGVYPNCDMISFGPTMQFPHSPDERLNIPSVQKFWDFLAETLKNVPKK